MEGGAVYASGSELYFENCTFINGTGAAGALELRGCESTLWNCLIANNYGYDYGAMLLAEGSCSFLNSSLLFNDSEFDHVAGIYCASDLSVINSILWGNYIPPGGDVFHLDLRENGTAFISHSAVQSGNTFGLDEYNYIQNLTVYPNFVRPITTPETDLAGKARIFNDSVDIGPYEKVWIPSLIRDEKINEKQNEREILAYLNPSSSPIAPTANTGIAYPFQGKEKMGVTGKSIRIIQSAG